MFHELKARLIIYTCTCQQFAWCASSLELGLTTLALLDRRHHTCYLVAVTPVSLACGHIMPSWLHHTCTGLLTPWLVNTQYPPYPPGFIIPALVCWHHGLWTQYPPDFIIPVLVCWHHGLWTHSTSWLHHTCSMVAVPPFILACEHTVPSWLHHTTTGLLTPWLSNRPSSLIDFIIHAAWSL